MGFLFRRERFGRVVLVAAVTYDTFTYGTPLWMFVFYVKCDSFKNSYVVYFTYLWLIRSIFRLFIFLGYYMELAVLTPGKVARPNESM